MNTLRRIDRKTSDADAMRILQDSLYGTLATVNEDGSPYCVPMSNVVWNGALYFHCARAGQKLENVRRDARAFYSCVLDVQILGPEFSMKYSSCAVEGRVEIVTDEAEREGAMRALCEKYCAGHVDTPAYHRTMGVMPAVVMLRMSLDEICGKANKGKLSD